MSRKAERPLVKRTLNLFADDVETLEKFFAKSGWSVGARAIIHKTCKALREKENAQGVTDDLNRISID
jgi:hypothetical protein